MADRNTPYRDGHLVVLPVASNASMIAGGMAGVNSSGYALNLADTSGLKAVGMSEEAVDNTGGGNGALTVRVLRRRVFLFKNSSAHPVTQAHVGGNVYVEDAVTVASSSSNSIVAGKCLGLESGQVWVEIA